jgi:hypothetical protein
MLPLLGRAGKADSSNTIGEGFSGQTIAAETGQRPSLVTFSGFLSQPDR